MVPALAGWLVEKNRESPQGRTNARSEKDSSQIEANPMKPYNLLDLFSTPITP